MFYNLRNALTHRGLTIKQYAEVLGVGDKTIQNKMTGKTDFTYPEFKKTCALLSEYNADYLFAALVNNKLWVIDTTAGANIWTRFGFRIEAHIIIVLFETCNLKLFQTEHFLHERVAHSSGSV